MKTRTKYIVGIIALLVVTVVVVVFAVVTSKPDEPKPQDAPPIARTNYKLTSDDKQDIELIANSYLESAGNYGWKPEILTNQTNLNLAKDAVDSSVIYENLTHTDPATINGNLNELSKSTQYGRAANTMIYDTPFSVTSKFTGPYQYPDMVSKLNGYPTIELVTPVTTTLSFIGQDYNYRDNDGKLIKGGLRYETLTFKSDLSVTVAKKGDGWVLRDFNQGTHVWATDKTFTFSNGQFQSTNADPTTYTVQTVGDDGKLSKPTDNLQHYKEAVENQGGLEDGNSNG